MKNPTNRQEWKEFIEDLFKNYEPQPYTLTLGRYSFTGDYEDVTKAWFEKAVELGYIDKDSLLIKSEKS